MKTRKEKSPLKDGCVWQAGPSWVVGQEAERGEGRPDETTSSTWVSLTLYICPRPSAQSQPIPTALPYGGFIFCCTGFLFCENSLLPPSFPFHFFFSCVAEASSFCKLLFFCDRTPPSCTSAGWMVSLSPMLSHDFVSELLYHPFPSACC